MRMEYGCNLLGGADAGGASTIKRLVVDVHAILRNNDLGQLALDGTGLTHLDELLTLSITGIELV